MIKPVGEMSLPSPRVKLFWRSSWIGAWQKPQYWDFKTRKAALEHSGKLLRNGYTVLGVTRHEVK